MDLVLRRLEHDDEDAFLKSPFARYPPSYYSEGMDFVRYLARLSEVEAGINLPPDHVPSVRYYGFVDGEIVGSLSVRLQLVGYLETLGGHIGYQVLEAHRRKGFGKEMLRQAIPLCARLGLDRVLVTCDADNTASKKIIEANGGVYESVIDKPNLRTAKLRYWIITSCSSLEGV